MNNKMFWSRVKAQIKEKGLTQQETSKACGISFFTFRNWIARNLNPPLMYAHRISQYLGVSLDYLISGSGKDIVSKTNEEILILLKEMEGKMLRIRRDASQIFKIRSS